LRLRKRPAESLVEGLRAEGSNRTTRSCLRAASTSEGEGETSEEYVNPLTGFLGNFIQKKPVPESSERGNQNKPVGEIDFAVSKRKKMPLNRLAQELEKALQRSEWFVTGRVDPSFFSENFSFEDPDVKVKGIEDYAKGVNKIFDQETSRAEVIETTVKSANNTITVTWRLEGKVNVGPGLRIKPYLVYTDFGVDPKSGLIVSQLDRFSIPSYDILLSAFFPFLATFLTPPAAPAAELLEAARKEKKKTK